MRMYKLAAEQQDPDAQFSLGEMYADGIGVPRNLEKAIDWFTKAAVNGHGDARKSLEKLKA